MINVSDLTASYISATFLFEKQKILYQSFNILENFGNKFYEDKLIEIISRDDDIDSDTKMDMFVTTVEELVKEIITGHAISLNNDHNPELSELNEIAEFLYIVQRLEDYDFISYRLHSENTAKNIIIDLIEYLSLLEKHRLMELIEDVSDNLIISLKSFIQDKLGAQDGQDNVDIAHFKYISNFFNFINNTKCLGLTYFNLNFSNITLSELINLSTLEISDYIDKLIITNQPQAALDCLSILLLCKDSYELPLLKFRQNSGLFTNKLENVTKLETLLLRMLSDFNNFVEAKAQEKKLNAY